MTFLPPLVAILALKPSLVCLFFLWGWYVLFIEGLIESTYLVYRVTLRSVNLVYNRVLLEVVVCG